MEKSMSRFSGNTLVELMDALNFLRTTNWIAF
jgi:hypothetical protein